MTVVKIPVLPLKIRAETIASGTTRAGREGQWQGLNNYWVLCSVPERWDHFTPKLSTKQYTQVTNLHIFPMNLK